MQFNQPIIINPPPFINSVGQLITPISIALNELSLIFIENQKSKTVNIKINNMPTLEPILLWSGDEYDNIGDWTQSQAEAKLMEILGDNPEVFLRSLFPKTIAETPKLPGTVLAYMVQAFGFVISDACSCKKILLEMNEKGNDWCANNIDYIISAIKIETTNRRMIIVDNSFLILVNRAIKKSRLLLSNQPVPDNDEELDNLFGPFKNS
jgi:hypothetical protein